MAKRENKVESYLDKQVKQLGGLTRKWVSPGRDGVPDRIVIVQGRVYFVEIKTSDGKLSDVQCREHQRLRDVGASVYTLFGENDVDYFLNLIN